MWQSNLFKSDVIGTVIAALCCFTLALLILFGAVGLSALVGYLDYVLLPILFIFSALPFAPHGNIIGVLRNEFSKQVEYG